MKPSSRRRARRENRALKRQFEEWGLPLAPVWGPSLNNLALENRQLLELADWVVAYRKCPDRKSLEKLGYRYPPIDPDYDPDTDWLRFERWLRHEPLGWNLERELGPLRDPATLTDEQLAVELERWLTLLEQLGICVNLFGPVPDRLVYTWLREDLAKQDFEVTAPGGFWMVGCPFWCPGCFQRPWCELGQELGWVEDKRAGKMVVPAIVEAFRQNQTA